MELEVCTARPARPALAALFQALLAKLCRVQAQQGTCAAVAARHSVSSAEQVQGFGRAAWLPAAAFSITLGMQPSACCDQCHVISTHAHVLRMCADYACPAHVC
jgi:hypothetical protein